MTKQTINVGSTAGDNSGDPLRTAFQKINSNTDELYSTVAGLEPAVTAPATAPTTKFYRGDKTFVAIDKTTVGLANVDNTSDASKPVSTAQLAALNLKAPQGNLVDAGLNVSTSRLVGRLTTGTGAVEELTASQAKTFLALNNVSNTADADKPISSATQTALDGKAATTHTHSVGALVISGPRIVGKSDTGSGPAVELTDVQTKTLLGLDKVNNTADTDKPLSTAATTALNNKAPLVHTHTIDQIINLQSSLDNKAAATHTHVIADVTGLQTALDSKADKTQLVRSVKFFMRANMVQSAPAVDVVAGTFTAVLANSVARATTANTTDVVFDVRKNNTSIGTITFSANTTTGVIAVPQASDLNFTTGDYIELYAPATGIDTLAGMTVVFRN